MDALYNIYIYHHLPAGDSFQVQKGMVVSGSVGGNKNPITWSFKLCLLAGVEQSGPTRPAVTEDMAVFRGGWFFGVSMDMPPKDKKQTTVVLLDSKCWDAEDFEMFPNLSLVGWVTDRSENRRCADEFWRWQGPSYRIHQNPKWSVERYHDMIWI